MCVQLRKERKIHQLKLPRSKKERESFMRVRHTPTIGEASPTSFGVQLDQHVLCVVFKLGAMVAERLFGCRSIQESVSLLLRISRCLRISGGGGKKKVVDRPCPVLARQCSKKK